MLHRATRLKIPDVNNGLAASKSEDFWMSEVFLLDFPSCHPILFSVEDETAPKLIIPHF